MNKIRKLPMFVKILIGFAIGILLGLVLKGRASFFNPVGELFMRMLKMLILPLVFSAIVSGLTSIPDMKKIYKLGIKAFALFILMTALAIATGMIFANVCQPGSGSAIEMPVEDVEVTTEVTFSSTILNMFPTNIFESLSSDSMLQVIVFAFFFGICIVICGERAGPVKAFFDGTAQIMYKMTDVVIGFAPIGVAGIMANMIGTYGMSTLLPLAKFILILHIALIFFVFVIQGFLIFIGVRMNPLKFFKQIIGGISMALATDSSAAALPVTIKELQSNLGVSEAVASFIMSVGTNVSKSGSALYQGMTVIFIAQVAGVQLSTAQQFTVFITALLAALGTAGVPSASIVMLTMTLGSVNLPLQGVALMAGIDRIIGGQRTCPNVITNAAISAILDRQEQKESKLETGNQQTENH